MHRLAIGLPANVLENLNQVQAKEMRMKKMWIWCLLVVLSAVSVASLHAKPADDTATVSYTHLDVYKRQIFTHVSVQRS